MKVTNKNARIDASGRHNDRNFDISKAPHINKDKISENKYFTYNGDDSHTFQEVEKEFYKIHFEDSINAQNKKNIMNRNGKRNKTVEDYYSGCHSRPEDKILQIGDYQHHASGEELWECALAYQEKFNEIYGDHCKILTMALHMDEMTPHVHIRRVWIAEDENGNEFVSQRQALEQMGIMDPDPEMPNGKYNNAKQTFTTVDIELFRNICIERGLDIDKASGKSTTFVPFMDYKRNQLKKTIDDLTVKERELSENITNLVQSEKTAISYSEKIADELENILKTYPFFDDIAELERIKKLKTAERLKELSKLLKEIVEELVSAEKYSLEDYVPIQKMNSTEKRENRHMRQFLEKENLLEKYEAKEAVRNDIKKEKKNTQEL